MSIFHRKPQEYKAVRSSHTGIMHIVMITPRRGTLTECGYASWNESNGIALVEESIRTELVNGKLKNWCKSCLGIYLDADESELAALCSPW